MLIDVHAHLDFDNFKEDLSEVIERAKKNNVVAIITNGINHEHNMQILKLSEKFPIIKPALGFYPSEIAKAESSEIDKTINFIRKNKNKIVAIGEIGLDYHLVKEEKKQKEIFIRLLQLSKELGIPVIVHSRKAEKDVIEILAKENIKKAVLHCFSGRLSLVKQGESKGWYFSIPVNIVNSIHFQRLVEEISINNILTETDAPFLSADKGKRNEPANIVHAINKIAEIKNLDKEETEKIIFSNFQKIFSNRKVFK